jgi:hypothetical protein
MAIIQSGASGSTLMSVDASFAAAHMTLRPPEQTGSYQIAAISGAVTGVGAGSPVFSMRWAPGTGALCLINSVTISAAVTTGFTAAQELEFGLFAARGFTVSDTGGTQQVISGNNQKMRTSMNTSLIASGGDMRISSTAALTAGTRTLDSQPMNANSFFSLAATTSSAISNVNIPLFDRMPGEYPITLANNEGIVINNILAMTAAGVIRLVVFVNWTEVATYGV